MLTASRLRLSKASVYRILERIRKNCIDSPPKRPARYLIYIFQFTY